MTDMEALTLHFLDSGRMEATPRQIGEHLIGLNAAKGSNYIAVGAAVAGRLQKLGLAMRLRDLNAWRITRAGRDALAAYRNPA